MRKRHCLASLVLLATFAATARAQAPVRYTVSVTDPTAGMYQVEAEVEATGATTLVSLPAWTPGHYTVENYARYVQEFEAFDAGSGAALDWDKSDKDTWRIASSGADRVRVRLTYEAQGISLSGSLMHDDFGYFNGTNIFVYPEGGYDFPAEVTFDLPDGWGVATELQDGAEPGTYRADDYHELVDNPTFLGHFAMDSVQVDDVWIRLAVYPASYLRDPARRMTLDALKMIAEDMHSLFGGVPYDRYTTLVYLAEEQIGFAGGLEHSESHLDVLPAVVFRQPQFAFKAFFYRLLSHEYYHAWNVKRIRPAALWPYQYDREQFTPLLWVSEGVTDYYAHLVLERVGLMSADEFWQSVAQSINAVGGAPHVAVEDASVSTWIEPTHIYQNFYYDKGLLLGLLLDIRIRDATEGARSLDDVMLRLYRDHYEQEEGFTTDDFLGYLAEHLGEEEVAAFYDRYVDGREELPYGETLALVGMSFRTDTIVEPFFGVAGVPQQEGLAVTQVVPGSMAAQAGLRQGDVVMRIGEVEVQGQAWGSAFRERFENRVGSEATITYRRVGQERTATGTIQTRTRYEHHVEARTDATETQEALRRGLLGESTVSN